MDLFKTKYYIKCFCILLFAVGMAFRAKAQKFILNDEDSSWLNEELPYKTFAKKEFKFPRKAYQNTVTRFNFYFNTKESFKRALSEAKRNHQEDYEDVLTVYPYGPEDFEQLKSRLDSVAENAGVGIQIHDQRAKRIPDLFLYYGMANYYLGDLPEAEKAFDYIVKNLDEPEEGKSGKKEKKAPEERKTLLTPEKKGKTPARNDAFVWLVKSYLSQDRLSEASALISAMENDEEMTDRIRGELYAIQAEFAWERDQTDSLLSALQKAIPLNNDKELKARWQFILAQLYQRLGKWAEAKKGYEKVSQYRPNADLKFYSLVNTILVDILENQGHYRSNTEYLQKMAKREKYNRYRSVIYFKLGQMALEKGNEEEAITFLQRSLEENQEDEWTHYRSNLLLADHFYESGKYKQAKEKYEAAASLEELPPLAESRKDGLTKVVEAIEIIDREDSLQYLANLPEDSLHLLISRIVEDSIQTFKRKNRILDEDPDRNNQNVALNDPMETEKRSSTGSTWYFYDQNLRSKGLSDFKLQWGKRKLEDNWRLSNPNRPPSSVQATDKGPDILSTGGRTAVDQMAQSYEQELLAPIPQNDRDMQRSQEKKIVAANEAARAFYLEIRDDPKALEALDYFLSLNPDSSYLPETYYTLYLIYERRSELEKSERYKQVLLTSFPQSEYAMILSGRTKSDEAMADNQAVEQLYNEAYINYLGGAYGKVSDLKQRALGISDSALKGPFDLLEAVSILKEKGESAGKTALQGVLKNNAGDTAVVQQAQLILSKLENKQKLIEHLLSLQLPEREKDIPDTQEKIPSLALSEAAVEEIPEEEEIQPEEHVEALPETRSDSGVANKDPVEEIPSTEEREDVAKVADAPDLPDAPLEEEESPVIQPEEEDVREDEISPVKQTPYKLERTAPHFVVLSFRKTNSEVIKQTAEAFSEYNRKHHEEDSIEVSSYVLARNQVILIFRLFEDELRALSYYKELKENGPKKITPFLPANAYRIFFISRENFILLNEKQDLEEYLRFFHRHFK